MLEILATVIRIKQQEKVIDNFCQQQIVFWHFQSLFPDNVVLCAK